ncbi:MAG TPA: BatD family protein [Flavitalea sp.]|nr:BatD family protein [Flavitalea sp.]
MKRRCKYILTIIFLLTIRSFLTAQVYVKASVDKNKVVIGEPITLTLEAYIPLGQQMTWFPLDTIPHFEFLKKAAPDTVESIEGKKITQVLTITSFDSGNWEIPQLELKVSKQSYYTDTSLIDVGFTPFDREADYRDIKNILEVSNPDTKYIPWAIGAAVLVSLALVIYFLRKRKTVAGVVKKEPKRFSPYEEAMHALAELRKKGLPQNGQVKWYYTELNDILRVFVFRKLNIATMEKTNEELIMQLRDLNLSRDSFTRLAQALRMSDSVKFAKYQPGSADNEKNYEIIQSAIQTLNTPETL